MPPPTAPRGPVAVVVRRMLAVPMFVKILGISVLAVVLFATIVLLYVWGAVAQSLDAQQRVKLAWSILAAAGICLLISVALAALLAHLLTRPMAQLAAAAQRIGEGDFDVRTTAAGEDEVGALADAFNRMAERLAEYQRAVRQNETDRLRLLERLVDSQEADRKRVARELHDQVAQSIMAIVLSVEGACRYRNMPESCCRGLEVQLRGLGDEIHRLACGMRPPVLDDFGLDSALERYLEDLAGQSDLEIDYQFDSPPNVGRLPEAVETALYRIVQESLTNVFRHAEAARVSVVVLRGPRDVTLVVEDDGCGFDTARVAHGNHGRLGLTGMRERAALLGGALTLESGLGRGTTVQVRIPLAEEEPCLSTS